LPNPKQSSVRVRTAAKYKVFFAYQISMAAKKIFWTAALAGGMWTPVYDGRSFTHGQAVEHCAEQLARRSGRMPTGEYEVSAYKAVSGALTIIVQR
jgi:hypothetical protein